MSTRAEISEADKGEIARRYVRLGQMPGEIVEALDGRVVLHQVKWVIQAGKLGAQRSPEVRAAMLARRTGLANAARAAKGKGFHWSDDRLVTFKRLYLVERLPPSEIARQFGGLCTADGVKRKAYALGWSTLRERVWPVAAPRGPRAAQTASLLPARGERASRAPSAIPRGLAASDAELIAHAIAEGRVTYCPTVAASGLTQIEQQFWAARPPPREIAAQVAARNARAGRAAALFHAGRKAVA